MDDAQVVAPETTVTTDTPVSVPVTAPPASDAAPSPSAPDAGAIDPRDPRPRHDIIRDALNKPTNNRGRHAAYQPREAGKFAPGTPQVPAQPDPLALPKSLKRELEGHWKQSPAELRQAIIQREADFDKGAASWKTRTEQADAILQQFQPYEWILRNENTTPQAAIGPLLLTAAILRTGTPQQKAQSVAQVMHQYGIPLEHIAAMFGHGQQQNAILDPQYNHLAQQVQHLTQAQQMQEQQLTQRAMTVIEQFAADPANQHFVTLQDKMLALLQTPHLLGKDVHLMSEREKLKLAYDTALRLDPQLSAQAAAKQQAEAQRLARGKAQGAANVAKAAAVQVNGAPGSASAPAVNANDRRSIIANALRAAQA